jgi:hypothetical protein
MTPDRRAEPAVPCAMSENENTIQEQLRVFEEAIVLLCDAIDAATWDLGQNGSSARDHAENARRLVRR